MTGFIFLKAQILINRTIAAITDEMMFAVTDGIVLQPSLIELEIINAVISVSRTAVVIILLPSFLFCHLYLSFLSGEHPANICYKRIF